MSFKISNKLVALKGYVRYKLNCHFVIRNILSYWRNIALCKGKRSFSWN